MHFQQFTYFFLPSCRVVKDALRSSGANTTPKHIEDVSLSGLFLADAAKKADQEFGVPNTSSKHTQCDCNRDIFNISTHLQNNQVTLVIPERTTPMFRDPTDDGWKKINSSWLERALSSYPTTELQPDGERGEVDMNYELFDVL